MKAYMVLWLFIYFLIYSNLDYMITFFMATLTFNLAVLTVLCIGIIMIMKASINLVMLAGTFGTLAYKKDNLAFYLEGIEKIMPANIAHMFHARASKGVMLFTVEESRTVVDWIDEKFSHQNRYTNYFIGTVLMIGLLGTFSGLLIAIDNMGRIILSLSGDIDLGKVIAQFAGPLGGMAVGFGSSLFGVISAIILGLMGYILNKNQEQLIEGVEDWLKGRIIDVGGNSGGGFSGGGTDSELPDHQNSFMDVFIENISQLTVQMKSIAQTNERLHSITIASVQQARDEHESTYDVLESMQTHLKTMAESSKNQSENMINEFSSMQKETLAEQLKTQKTFSEDISKVMKNIQDSISANSQSLSTNLQEFLTGNEKISKAIASKNIIQLDRIKDELTKTSSLIEKEFEYTKTSTKDANETLVNISQYLKKTSSLLDQENRLTQTILEEITNSTSNEEIISKMSNLMNVQTSQLGEIHRVEKFNAQSLTKLNNTLKSLDESVGGIGDNDSMKLTQLKRIGSDIQNLQTQVKKDVNVDLDSITESIDSLNKNIKQQSSASTTLINEVRVTNQHQVKNSKISAGILHEQRSILNSIDGSNENSEKILKSLEKLDTSMLKEIKDAIENIEIKTEIVENGSKDDSGFFSKLFK